MVLKRIFRIGSTASRYYVLLVSIAVLAFTVMAFLHYFFSRSIEQENMLRETNLTLSYLGSLHEADQREIAAIVGFVGDAIGGMLQRREDIDDINAYMIQASDYIRDKTQVKGFAGLFVMYTLEDKYFDDIVFNGLYPDTDWEAQYAAGYTPSERLWYRLAETAGEQTLSTVPHLSITSGEIIITMVRNVFAENGERIAIICLNASLEGIYELSEYPESGEGVYWLIMDKDMNFVSHPRQEVVGRNIRDMDTGIELLADELEREHFITERRVRSYDGRERIFSITRLEDGYYVGIAVETGLYYSNLHRITWFLSSVGAVLAAILSYVLVRAAMNRTKAEEHSQLLLDGMPLGAYIWTRDVRIIAVNDALVKVLGLSGKREFFEKFGTLSPEYQPDGKRSTEKGGEYIRRAFDEGFSKCEWVHITKDGEHIPCEVSFVRVKYGNDYVVATYYRDLREQKAMLEKLAQEHERTEEMVRWYHSLLDAIPLPVTVTDKDMKWVFVNAAVEEFLGRKREDMMGRLCSEWDAHICNTDDCGIACIRRGIKQTYFSHNDQSYQVDVEILKDSDGKTTGYIEVVQNITEVQELTTQKAQADIANKAKSVFLATVSHEIRTPMNTILGIAEIQLETGKLTPECEEAFSQIYNAGDLLLGIINDILDISKIEAGKMELKPARYDIPSLIIDSIQLNKLRYDSKPIELNLDIDENTPQSLIGDELRIKQILNNVLSNAFKYTDKGEVKLSVWPVYSSQQEPTIVFEISDTGLGMTQEQVALLFIDYTRFNMEANRSTIGTGLGLSITKRLVDLMSGKISIKSEAGKGSTVTIKLPQAYVDAAVCGPDITAKLRCDTIDSKPLRKEQFTRRHMPHGKVLVVDDVKSNLYVTRGLLLPYALTIETVESGFEAIEKIKSGNVYDIIFMDHMMPKMDGMEATQIIRDMGYTGYIVALTADALVGQAEIFLQNGFDGYIPKPIDSRELNAILNRFVVEK